MNKEKKEPVEAQLLPNYKKRCIVCGSVPTIDIHPLAGAKKVITEMCGPCTWGDSETELDEAKMRLNRVR